MDLAGKLESERRTRLATERMLSQMRSELGEANRQLALHARGLTTELRSNRAETARVRSEALHLKHEVSFAQQNLQRAESAMVIAERRLWASLETIRDGFAVFGPDNRLIAANRSYLALFDGLEMVKPGVEMALLIELLADEGLVDIGDMPSKEWQAKMLARIEEPRIDYATLKLWNGQFVQLIDRRTRDGDLVTLALNITDQTRREDQLREAREKAEAANRAKSAFLANMSHEIRTPMNGVIAMAELLAETELDDDQRSFLETIRSSGEALLVIINDVLDYSKIEADKVEFKRAEFDLERCVHDVVTLLQPGAHDKGLQLAIDFDLFLPNTFVGDAGRIRQVLTNLVGNAIKFTEKGHVLIRVLGLPAEEDAVYQIHVTVEDTGIGIPEDKLDSIFQEFQQVENEKDRRHDGTGLGLAITQKLVRAMGGDMWVESRVDEGSGFGFSLPLPAIDSVEPDRLRAPDWMRRALLLDRPGMNRDVLGKQLAQIGLEVVPVDTLQALHGARPGPSDIVFVGTGALDDDLFTAVETLKLDYAPGGLFLVSHGPAKVPDSAEVAFDVLLKRPVMRATMLNQLSAMIRPDSAGSDGVADESAPDDGPVTPASGAVPEDAADETLARETEAPAPVLDDAPFAETLPDDGPDPEGGDIGLDQVVPEIPPVATDDAETNTEAVSDDEPLAAPTLDQAPDVEFAPVAPTLPETDEPALADVTDIAPPDAPAPAAGPRRMRVLAAEDNKTNRFVFEKMLKGLEIDLEFAENGLEAVEAFERARPDIVFTDISMPKMDGKEATRRIRAIEAERGDEPCPIVAITAHAMEGDAEDILAAGVDRYLTKPIKKQLLLDEILAAQPLDAVPALPLPEEAEEIEARQAG